MTDDGETDATDAGPRSSELGRVEQGNAASGNEVQARVGRLPGVRDEGEHGRDSRAADADEAGGEEVKAKGTKSDALKPCPFCGKQPEGPEITLAELDAQLAIGIANARTVEQQCDEIAKLRASNEALAAQNEQLRRECETLREELHTSKSMHGQCRKALLDIANRTRGWLLTEEAGKE